MIENTRQTIEKIKELEHQAKVIKLVNVFLATAIFISVLIMIISWLGK